MTLSMISLSTCIPVPTPKLPPTLPHMLSPKLPSMMASMLPSMMSPRLPLMLPLKMVSGRRRSLPLLISLAVVVSFPSSMKVAFAQTVGNGTVIPLSAGQREAYGLNALNTSQYADVHAAVGGFATRHYKRGGESGIGGSFLQTTSPTSESSPAVVQSLAVPVTMQEFRLPRLESAPVPNVANPALRSLSPALPMAPSVTTLTSPSSWSGATRPVGVEELPSFSRQESPLSRMQFERYGFGGFSK